ncbi:hypothetical protein IJ750_00825 [bacterium]|nr:hypothetical protein [bacterium]MBR1775602.1 hypothetical protein [bacterium]
MRVSNVTSCNVYGNCAYALNSRKTKHNPQAPTESVSEPSFKGSNFFKALGMIGGTVAVIVAAPAVAMAGLAGLGAMAGLVAGEAVDEKIDEMNEKNKNNDKKETEH